jgi:hypothetical protein
VLQIAAAAASGRGKSMDKADIEVRGMFVTMRRGGNDWQVKATDGGSARAMNE